MSMTNTEWEKTLKKADEERAKVKAYDRQAELDTAKAELDTASSGGSEIAAAIRYCGNIMLASLIIGVIGMIIVIATAASQM